MIDVEQKLSNLLTAMKGDFPNFKIISKEESTFMRLLSKVLFFNKGFMTRFITVIGQTIYVPSNDWITFNPGGALIVLAHEWMHMKDNRRWGILYSLAYLSPQIFASFALLGLWNPWFFLFVLCLLPIPSPFRAWIEMRGYTMSMAARWWLFKEEPNFEKYSKYFTTSFYFWMFPFKGFIIGRLRSNFERIESHDLNPHELDAYRVIVKE